MIVGVADLSDGVCADIGIPSPVSSATGWLLRQTAGDFNEHEDSVPVPREQRRHHIIVRRSCIMALLTLAGTRACLRSLWRA